MVWVRHRDGEVDPDGALNGENQQDGQSGGFKGKQQDDHDEQDGEDTDLHIVLSEGVGQIQGVGGVAHQKYIVSIVLLGDGADLAEKGLGLFPLRGHIGHKDHAGPVLAAKLLQANIQLLLQIVHLVCLFAGQVNHPFIPLLQQELKYIDQGNSVVIWILEDGSIFLSVEAIGLIEQPGQLDVYTGQLCELPGGHLVGQHPVVLHLGVGKSGGCCDGFQAGHLPEDLSLVFIAAPGDQDGDGVFLSEGAADLFFGQLPVRFVAEIGIIGVKDVAAAVGQHGTDHQDHQKDRGEDVAEVDDPLAEPVDVGDQIAVAGPLDGTAEQHQQAGHQQKDAQHTEDDALGQHNAHIEADTQLHSIRATSPEMVVRLEEEISMIALLRAAMSASRASRPLSRSSIYRWQKMMA